MIKFKGDDDIGNAIGDMKVVTQSAPIDNIDQTREENKCADADVTAEEYVGMCDNLKKFIARIQEKIRQDTNNVTTQMENNLGSRMNLRMLSTLTEQMQVAKAYSPPHVVEMANRIGMRGGVSISQHVTQTGCLGISTMRT